MKILLLEDDPMLCDILSCHLQESGFELKVAMDGQSAFTYASEERFDLFIFDINVPKKSGLELISQLRSFANTTPAILITAYQDTTHMKRGFESGCDDYIKKPFDLEELDLRINNIKKRFSIESEEKLILCEDIFLYPDKNSLHVKNKIHQISRKEREILIYLGARKKRVVSSEELMQNLWEYEEMPSDATIRVYIKNLRHIIGQEHIKTIRGSGYYFE